MAGEVSTLARAISVSDSLYRSSSLTTLIEGGVHYGHGIGALGLDHQTGVLSAPVLLVACIAAGICAGGYFTWGLIHFIKLKA